jgi:glycosyltransferase involved in cell wall biosynthesis
MSIVVFHRDYKRFQGGHLKVFQYFEHVRSSPSHQARIHFSPDSVWDESNPWRGVREAVIRPGESVPADMLFLAGMDWRWLEPEQRAASSLPIVNLIQGFSAARGKGSRHDFLAHPAIRICVSAEIQDALESTGSVEGPIFTIPIGIDLESLPAPRPTDARDIDCVVLAIKDPPLGRGIADDLLAVGYRVQLVDRVMPRQGLLAAMARARVTVHLPGSFEGAYLPALESMALGAAVVCPDCVGNRSFCRDGDTCLVPARSRRAIVEAALELLTASADQLEPMLAAARRQAVARSLQAERDRFLEIVDRVDDLWAGR